MSKQTYDIAVIGGGAAGIMATLRGVLNNDTVLLLPGSGQDKKKSRAMWVRKIENMPGFHQYKKGIDDPNRDTIKWIEESDFKDNLTQLKTFPCKAQINCPLYRNRAVPKIIIKVFPVLCRKNDSSLIL